MRKEELLGEAVFVVRSFLTPEECAACIAASEQTGYADAPITMGEGTIILKDYRDNMRVMTDDAKLAADLFLRAGPFLPSPLDGRLVTGLNERLRYYRYDVGQTFAAHYDGSFRRNDREESLLTFMIYLNQDYAGGTTDFYQEDGTPLLSVQPEEGMALIFRHELLHSGTAVQQGRKYVLRTDVMYALPEERAE